ncbi:MAG: hypothetical protein NTX49_00105 [Chlamydiae bacterium]|nr:hypothetical protein [Chlamydiota bacterium]
MASAISLYPSSAASTSSSPYAETRVDLSSIDARTRDLFARTLDVARELDSRGITSIHDIIPCSEIFGINPKRCLQLYEKYGERFLEYIETMDKLECTRIAYKSMLQSSAVIKPFQFPSATFQLAITNEKVAGCGELSILATLIAAQKGLFGCQVLTKDSNEASPYYHGFVVIFADKAEASAKLKDFNKERIGFFETLERMKGIIYDPYLKVVVPSELARQDPRFIEGLSSMRIVDIESINDGPILAQLAIVNSQSELLTQCVREKKMIKENLLPLSDSSHLLRFFAINTRTDLIIAKLEQLFPETSWKFNSKARCIHGIFPELQARGIHENLLSKGITSIKFGRAPSKDPLHVVYGVQITIPDFGAKELLDRLRA